MLAVEQTAAPCKSIRLRSTRCDTDREQHQRTSVSFRIARPRLDCTSSLIGRTGTGPSVREAVSIFRKGCSSGKFTRREMLTPRPLLPHRIANVIAVQLIRDLYARPLPAVRRAAALAPAVGS